MDRRKTDVRPGMSPDDGQQEARDLSANALQNGIELNI